MFLLALPFASDQDLTDKNLSFRWSKRRPKISGSENELEFKSLLTGHFKGFISCEIFMNQKPFFTVYHCLKESVGKRSFRAQSRYCVWPLVPVYTYHIIISYLKKGSIRT